MKTRFNSPAAFSRLPAVMAIAMEASTTMLECPSEKKKPTA